jgi:hypothetical protein
MDVCVWRHPRSLNLSWLLVAGVGALLAALALPATGHAIALSCVVPAGGTDAAAQRPLRFGIYPGGPVGSVNPKAPQRPEDPAKRLATLQALAGSSPFVVRLYSAWTGDASADDVGGWLDRQMAGYTTAGLEVELVVRYKPAQADPGTAPAAFADYVRGIARRYGSDSSFVSLQVTNEANLPGAPDASDGAFAGAAEAVVKGVIAAKEESLQDGYRQLRIGFSWGYDERPEASTNFWATLGRLGGRRFVDAVDWVGLDSYPGTWVPQIPRSNLAPGLAARGVKESVRSLRDCLMPLAGLGNATAIHIAENGFPTGAGRSEETQSRVLAAMVRSVDAIRATYGVTDYRWFDLRDSSSADPSIESQYGITRDDYSPKAAFATYRDLIARYSVGRAPPAGAAHCRSSPVAVSIPQSRGGGLTSLAVNVGGKVLMRVRRAQMPHAVRVSMRSGSSAVKLRLTARENGRRLTRVALRTYRVC